MGAKATIELDRYVVETLMRDLVGHDRRPSAFLVYVAIAGLGAGKAQAMSYSELSEVTGLSRRAVQDAVAHLARRKLLETNRVGPTETALYRALSPWRRG